MKNRFSNIFPNFFVRAKWEKNSIHVNEADLKIFKPFFMMCIKSMTSIKLHIYILVVLFIGGRKSFALTVWTYQDMHSLSRFIQ